MRTILWFEGNYHCMYDKWINSDDIVAIVSDEELEDNQFKNIIIHSNQLKDIIFDQIVLFCYANRLNQLTDYLLEIGVDRDKIINVDSYLSSIGIASKICDDVSKRQQEVVKKILEASEEEIKNRDFLKKLICEYGVFCFDKKFADDAFWTVYGLQQVVDEFADLCFYLMNHDIESALEIGVFRGRSSYFLCAILMRNNPNIEYYMVDIVDKLDHFTEFKKLLPGLVKCIPSQSKDFNGKSFDFVFIDADHSYEGSMSDYNNVGQFANTAVVFHDIYAHEYDNENGGTVRMWKEVVERTKDKRHFVFSKYLDVCMGIGCIEM